jgi:hypothetical protein
MGFQVAVDLTALGPLLGITALQDSREPLADEALFEADDRTTTDLKGLGNLSIGEWLLLATIRFEEHAGHDLLIRAGFPCPDEAVKRSRSSLVRVMGYRGTLMRFSLLKSACDSFSSEYPISS